MLTLSGKTILVTGATGALGAACCQYLMDAEASVFATGRREELLAKLGCPFFVTDLTAPEGRDDFIDAIPECDGVVFSHGLSGLLPAKYLSAESIDKLMQANLTATLATLGLLLKRKRLRPGASIVFIASVAALKGTSANTAYAASKGALVAATRSLAVELARQQIRVNALCPGWIQTELTDKVSASVTDESAQEEAGRYPLGPGKPQDVAAAAHFLISEAARWITGTALPVDGGYTCQ